MKLDEVTELSLLADSLMGQYASLESLKQEVVDTASISQSTLIEADGFGCGLESERFPIHAYSRMPSKTNYQAGLEAFDFKLVGLIVAAVTAIIALISKLLGASGTTTGTMVSRAADIQKSIAIQAVEDDAISAIIEADVKLKGAWEEAKHAAIVKAYNSAFGIPERHTGHYNRKNTAMNVVSETKLAMLFAVINKSSIAATAIKGYKPASLSSMMSLSDSVAAYISQVVKSLNRANEFVRVAAGRTFGEMTPEEQADSWDDVVSATKSIDENYVSLYFVAHGMMDLQSFSTPKWHRDGRARMLLAMQSVKPYVNIQVTDENWSKVMGARKMFSEQMQTLIRDFSREFGDFIPEGKSAEFVNWYKRIDYHNYSKELADKQNEVQAELGSSGATPVQDFENVMHENDANLEDLQRHLANVEEEIRRWSTDGVTRNLGNAQLKSKPFDRATAYLAAIQTEAKYSLQLARLAINISQTIYRRENAAMAITTNGYQFFGQLNKNLNGFVNVVVKNSKDERDMIIKKAMEYVDNLDSNFR